MKHQSLVTPVCSARVLIGPVSATATADSLPIEEIAKRWIVASDPEKAVQ